jgi:hypothetical protein
MPLATAWLGYSSRLELNRLCGGLPGWITGAAAYVVLYQICFCGFQASKVT